MDVRAELKSLLNEMGNTPDEVAATLRTSNVKGVRNTVRTLNPVTRYIQIRFKSEAVEFDVMKADAVRIAFPKDRHEEEALPQPVSDFLLSFNRGGYPDLELNGEDA